MILEKETNENCSNFFSSGKNHDQIWKCQLLAHGDGTNENHEQILNIKVDLESFFFLFFVQRNSIWVGVVHVSLHSGRDYFFFNFDFIFFFFFKLILAVVVVVARSKGVATQFLFTTQHVVGANLTAARFFFPI